VSYSGGGVTASFVYDSDGNRVKAMFNGTTTVYVGDYYEKTGSVWTTYYRRSQNSETARMKRPVAELEAELAKKDAVLGEVMEKYVILEKAPGAS